MSGLMKPAYLLYGRAGRACARLLYGRAGRLRARAKRSRARNLGDKVGRGESQGSASGGGAAVCASSFPAGRA